MIRTFIAAFIVFIIIIALGAQLWNVVECADGSHPAYTMVPVSVNVDGQYTYELRENGSERCK